MKGDEILIETRISAIAGSKSNDEAFAILQRLADTKLDCGCVDAMLKNADKILEIQQRFCDEEVV